MNIKQHHFEQQIFHQVIHFQQIQIVIHNNRIYNHQHEMFLIQEII